MALTYIEDFSKGYFRKKKGKHFAYYNEGKKKIEGKETIARIEELVIPPAWNDVWISRDANTHILATGIDEKERKQYIYHPKWIAKKQREKYDRVIQLGYALPRIRRRVLADLKKEKFSKEVVLAIVVRILDKTGMRIGNEKYTQKNKTFGLTTLREKHMEMTGKEITFRFTGKSHQEQEYSIDDPILAKNIRVLEDIPGREIFHYLDENGKKQKLLPDDVNAYIDAIASDDGSLHFSAKDFRTWIGTTYAVGEMIQYFKNEEFPLSEQCQVDIIKRVAQELGNTPAVCREHYVHPQIQKMCKGAVIPEVKYHDIYGLSKVEQATLYYLEMK